jgi:hypothetical protein
LLAAGGPHPRLSFAPPLFLLSPPFPRPRPPQIPQPPPLTDTRSRLSPFSFRAGNDSLRHQQGEQLEDRSSCYRRRGRLRLGAAPGPTLDHCFVISRRTAPRYLPAFSTPQHPDPVLLRLRLLWSTLLLHVPWRTALRPTLNQSPRPLSIHSWFTLVFLYNKPTQVGQPGGKNRHKGNWRGPTSCQQPATAATGASPLWARSTFPPAITTQAPVP